MAKLSVAQAAEQFKVSREAIHNRIRRGSLDCVIEHGMKYVLIDEPAAKVQEGGNDKYHAYIEEENQQLKAKIRELEQQNLSLREQKELMLIEEKRKIEQIYKERDEQLRQVLSTISAKFLPQVENVEELIPEEKKTVEATLVEAEGMNQKPIRLKEFLKMKGYKPGKHLRVKNRFKKLAGRDERVFKQAGKIYINPAVFDYGDILE